MKKIYQYIFFRIMKWKIVGTLEESTKKCIMIVVPHTSWHDFYIGVLTRGSLNMEINFVAKKELFKFPFGFYFKWMGGAPLNRKKSQNKVEAIATIFKNREVFRLAIAPEGTRKKVTEWKTGFYYIALKANIPIVCVGFNFGKKQVEFSEPFYPTGDIETDLKILKKNYIGVIGKKSKYSFTLDE